MSTFADKLKEAHIKAVKNESNDADRTKEAQNLKVLLEKAEKRNIMTATESQNTYSKIVEQCGTLAGERLKNVSSRMNDVYSVIKFLENKDSPIPFSVIEQELSIDLSSRPDIISHLQNEVNKTFFVIDYGKKTIKYKHTYEFRDSDELLKHLKEKHERCEGGLNMQLVINGNSALKPEIERLVETKQILKIQNIKTKVFLLFYNNKTFSTFTVSEDFREKWNKIYWEIGTQSHIIARKTMKYYKPEAPKRKINLISKRRQDNTHLPAEFWKH